jgi:C1A family cysteine protease
MRKFVLSVMAAVLIALPALSGAAVFQPLRPDIEAKIKAIRDQVRAKGGTFEVGYSAAMDKRIDQLCGLRVPPGWNKNDAPQVPMLEASVQAVPSSYDWRTLNGVTPIKNQGSCGDCWAFGTVGPLESQILLKDGVTVDLSEQYLTSCNLDGWGCNGGWWAHDYHMNRSGQDNNGPGAVLESSKPYTGTDSTCAGPYNHPYKISNWAYVGSQTAVPGVQAIKQAIYTYGPISVAVYVGNAFQAYSGGIFNTNESGSPNHAVVLVGWNDDLGTDNGYWILRNSWGSSWGESGYMRIRYNISKVGYGANFIEYAGGSPAPTPTLVTVPDVVGSTQSAATAALTAAGLMVGTVTTQTSTTIATGLVISENPTAGTKATSGSAVNLVVSSGSAPPTPSSVTVPNVVGTTQAAATTSLTAAGLVVGTVTTQASTTVASGLVISENPAARTSVTKGSAVNLVVSSGSAPPATSKPDLAGAFTSLYASYSGRTLYGTFQVQNKGTAATSSSFRVLLYLSNDGVAKTTLLGSATISTSLPANSYTNLSISKSSTTSFRGKYAICVVDPDNTVPESSESNNVIVKLIQ